MGPCQVPAFKMNMKWQMFPSKSHLPNEPQATFKIPPSQSVFSFYLNSILIFFLDKCSWVVPCHALRWCTASPFLIPPHPPILLPWKKISPLICFLLNTVDPQTMQGLGVLTLCVVENTRITLQSALCIHGPSVSEDSTNHGSFHTVVFTTEKIHTSGSTRFKPVLFKGWL